MLIVKKSYVDLSECCVDSLRAHNGFIPYTVARTVGTGAWGLNTVAHGIIINGRKRLNKPKYQLPERTRHQTSKLVHRMNVVLFQGKDTEKKRQP